MIAAESDGAAADIDGKGFEIKAEVAGGDVLIVSGASDARETLEEIETVDGAAPDLEVDPPTVEESADYDDEEPAVPPESWDWDRELIDAYDALEHATGEGTRLGFIDSGIAHHPDLSNLNTELSRRFTSTEILPWRGDSGFHGTFCAGFAAGTGDDFITGVAPETELVSLERGGSVSSWLLALDYAAEIDCDAVNMSFGLGPYPPQENSADALGTIKTAMELGVRDTVRRGTTVVVSQGNEAMNIQQGGYIRPWATLASSIGVSATTVDDELADFSNYGTNEVDVGAPGEDVLGPMPPEENDPAWMVASGTSASAPLVAGLALLVRELRPDFNPARVQQAIEQNAELANGRSDPHLGAGRINALNTVESLL